MSEIYKQSNILAIIVDLSWHVKYDLTSDFLDFRPHVKGIYIYRCKADSIFDLYGIEVGLTRKVGQAG